MTILPLAATIQPALAIAAAQLLNVLVEENETVLRQFAENESWAPTLVSLLRSCTSAKIPGYKPLDLQTLSLLLASILHGIAGIPGDPALAAEAGDLALSAIASTLSQTEPEASFLRAVEFATKSAEEDQEIEDAQVPQSLGGRNGVERGSNPVFAEWEAAKLALEVLSNLCSDPSDPIPVQKDQTEDEEEEVVAGEDWEDVDMETDAVDGEPPSSAPTSAPDDDELGEDEDDEFPDDEEMEEVLGDQGTAAKIDSGPLASKIDTLGILASVRKLASVSPVLLSADPARATEVSGLLEVQHRALGALNNILMAMDKTWFSKHTEDLAGLWEWTLGVLEGTEAVKGRVPEAADDAAEVLDATLGSMLALARGLMTPNPALLAEINLPLATPLGTIAKLASLRRPGQTVPSLIPLLSILGQRRPGQLAENLEVGRFLVGIATEAASPLEEVADALDALFDVYAEWSWDYDSNWKSEGWLEKLRAAYGAIRNKVRLKAREFEVPFGFANEEYSSIVIPGQERRQAQGTRSP